MKNKITAIVLTNNEEKHILRCISSLRNVVSRIVVIDSFSTDNTLKILKENKIEYFQKAWINYSSQFNWGIEKADVKNGWILRIDPDEVLSKNFQEKIIPFLDNLAPNICGVSILRRYIFLGKEINKGGDFPQQGVRIWKTNKGKCENTWSDEHIEVDGDIIVSDLDIIDNNINNIAWWTDKHNRFAEREMIEFFSNKKNKNFENETKMEKSEKFKKKLKFNIYYKFPLFLRPFLYFIYKYFLKFGFLNGIQGFLWCFLQGFWYRMLVDVKIYEINKISKYKNITNNEAIRDEYQIDI